MSLGIFMEASDDRHAVADWQQVSHMLSFDRSQNRIGRNCVRIVQHMVFTSQFAPIAAFVEPHQQIVCDTMMNANLKDMKDPTDNPTS
jgi:hypothetical protein